MSSFIGNLKLIPEGRLGLIPEQVIPDHAQNICPKKSILALFKIQDYFSENQLQMEQSELLMLQIIIYACLESYHNVIYGLFGCPN